MVEVRATPAVEVGFRLGCTGSGWWGEVVEETGFGGGGGSDDVFEVAGGVGGDMFKCCWDC